MPKKIELWKCDECGAGWKTKEGALKCAKADIEREKAIRARCPKCFGAGKITIRCPVCGGSGLKPEFE